MMLRNYSVQVVQNGYYVNITDFNDELDSGESYVFSSLIELLNFLISEEQPNNKYADKGNLYVIDGPGRKSDKYTDEFYKLINTYKGDPPELLLD